jgi:hypothetical protein
MKKYPQNQLTTDWPSPVFIKKLKCLDGQQGTSSMALLKKNGAQFKFENW